MSKEFEMILSKLNGLEKEGKEQKELNKEALSKLNSLEKEGKEQKELNKEQKKFQETVLKQLDEQKEFNKEVLRRFDTLERTVTIIEDEVKNKIPALFNADLTRQQKENSLQSEVDHLR